MATRYWTFYPLLCAALLCYCCGVEGGEVPEKEICINGESWLMLAKIFLAEKCGNENCCVTKSQWHAWAELAEAFLPALRKIPDENPENDNEKRFSGGGWYK